MYEDQETLWFNQELYKYTDEQSADQTTLRLSLVTTSTNFKYFNRPFLSLQIGNNHYTKTAILHIQNAEDLYEAFMVATKTLDWNKGATIERRYQSHIGLVFNLLFSEVLSKRIVKISAVTNESDIISIILPVKPAFQSFVRRLKHFIDGYDSLAYQLLVQSTFSEERQIIRNLPLLIKSSIAQLVRSTPDIYDKELVNEQETHSQAIEENIDSINTTNEEFEKFIQDNINTIEIPEIDKLANETSQQEKVTHLTSIFVSKVLENNLNNLETKLNSLSASTNPVILLSRELSEKCNIDLLKRLSENELKSLVYLSKLLKDVYLVNYTSNNTEIPTSLPVLRFKSSLEMTETLSDIWKSILTCTSYIRIYRNRLKDILLDAYENGSVFYLHLRCFMDAFCFSFLSKDTISLDELKSTIQERFKSFDRAGVFNYYKNVLETNGVDQIDADSIINFVTRIYNSLDKIPYIYDLHKQLYEQASVKLPPENSLSLEQITEEFVPLEVAVKVSPNEMDNNALNNLKEHLSISNEVFDLFNKKQTKKRERIFPLLRFVNNFKQDIPAQYVDDVIKHVKSLQESRFNFKESPWPLEEFDEDIVKALYVWDPENDDKMRTNYSYFVSLVKDEPMSKGDILLATQQDNETTDDWSNLI